MFAEGNQALNLGKSSLLEFDELWAKFAEGNQIITFDISIDGDKIDSTVCRRFLNNVIYDNNSNYKIKNKINMV